MKAWHFLQDDGRLRWKCGRYRKPKIGQTLTVDPDRLELCQFGLHASKRIIDALNYAPGALICRVEIGGRIIHGNDKLVASERTIIQMADVTDILHEMACWSAERALKNIKNPDPRSIAAIDAKRKWLRGEITDDELSAARSAARSAEWSAARSAAESAAWSARSAAESARSAAGSARSAARSAAESARSAAWSAAESAESAAGSARSAARSAAESARSAQNRQLTKMVNTVLRGQHGV